MYRPQGPSNLDVGVFKHNLTRLCQELQESCKCGEQGLAHVPGVLVKEFSNLVDSLNGFHSHDIAASIGQAAWLEVVNLHSLTLRQLDGLSRSGNTRVQKGELLLGATLFLIIKSNALKAGSAFGGRLGYVLILTETFHCYARLLSLWSNLPPEVIEPKLRLIAQNSLILSSCAQLTVSDQPLNGADISGSALYESCLRALSASQLLEHMSRTLLRILEAASGAGDGQSQGRNIRLGVMETCGCIVSALHGIAGKHGLLDQCWAASEGERRLSGAGSGDNEEPQDLATRLLSLARTVLSGPCLQFLLGREIVASRLRLMGGVGPRFGLPDSMLPELNGLEISTHVPNTLQDRMLSRLGAAALVWHLVLPVMLPQPEGQPAAAPQPGAPALLYSPANIFDMVLEALACVVDPSISVDHLPGGSQLTLVEPAMLLVRLAIRLRPKHIRTRLGKLWQVLTMLLRRPLVRLQYAEHRPLQLIGGLLKLDPSLVEQQQQGGGAGAGVAAAAEDALAASRCSFNLRCALDAGLVPTIEQLLRGWGRAASSVSRSETSCLCTVNHLLRWPCIWTAVLAHGSVKQVASLIITLRRLGEVFKERGFEAMSQSNNNEPNEHQDAEVVVTAYVAALLEQQADVLLQPSGAAGEALALNGALESGDLPVEAIDRLGGRPPTGTREAAQQQALAVFAVSQWLPNAVWLARVVDTWFSVPMGKSVLRWVLEAALQCLVARMRSEAECLERQGQQAPATDAAGGAGEVSSNGSAGPCGPGAVAYLAWVTFLMIGVDMLAWINKYFAQLKELEGSQGTFRGADMQHQPRNCASGEDVGAGGGESERYGGLKPKELLPSVLDILEVLVLAVPRSVRQCVTRQNGDVRAGETDEASAGLKVASAAEPSEPSQPSTLASASAASSGTGRPKLDRYIVLDDWLRGLLEVKGRCNLLSVLDSWGKEDSRSDKCEHMSGGEPGPVALGIVPEEETPELAALRAEVSEKHRLAHLPDLPSPYTAAEVVEGEGLKLCANPACMNLDGPSEAELSGRKTCRFCKSVCYCSSKCQLEHWNNQHNAECSGWSQRQ